MARYHFFMSYSSKDKLPLRFCKELEKKGVSCWIAPRNINPGAPYARAIMDGLESADNLLVFISSNSLKSEDVLNEIDNAHRLKKQIIPIFIEPIKLSTEFAYYLSRKQWINSYAMSICDAVQFIMSSTAIDGKYICRNTIAKMVELRNTLDTRNRNNGRAVFADIIIRVESSNITNERVLFVNKVPGNDLPQSFISAVKDGVTKYCSEEDIVGVEVTLLDGSFHPAYSNEIAFMLVAENAMKKAIEKVGLIRL